MGDLEQESCEYCTNFTLELPYLDYFTHNLFVLLRKFNCECCYCRICKEDELLTPLIFVVLSHALQRSFFDNVEECKCWDCRYACVTNLPFDTLKTPKVSKLCSWCCNRDEVQQYRPFVLFVMHRLLMWLSHCDVSSCSCFTCSSSTTCIEAFERNLATIQLAHNLAKAMIHLDCEICNCETCCSVRCHDKVLFEICHSKASAIAVNGTPITPACSNGENATIDSHTSSFLTENIMEQQHVEETVSNAQKEPCLSEADEMKNKDQNTDCCIGNFSEDGPNIITEFQPVPEVEKQSSASIPKVSLDLRCWENIFEIVVPKTNETVVPKINENFSLTQNTCLQLNAEHRNPDKERKVSIISVVSDDETSNIVPLLHGVHCNSVLLNKQLLFEHITSECHQKKNYVCEHCFRQFGRLALLQDHNLGGCCQAKEGNVEHLSSPVVEPIIDYTNVLPSNFNLLQLNEHFNSELNSSLKIHSKVVSNAVSITVGETLTLPSISSGPTRNEQAVWKNGASDSKAQYTVSTSSTCPASLSEEKCPKWNAFEESVLLQALAEFEVLTTRNPQKIAGEKKWQFVSSQVSQSSFYFRSAQQCQLHYEETMMCTRSRAGPATDRLPSFERSIHSYAKHNT